jgi:putative ABC transport system permease protein
MGTLVVLLLVALAVTGAVIAVLALRNRILVRLGVRNVGRRRARSALIIVGLMLGTTITSAALTTGDTMSNTIRETAVDALGETDIVVSTAGAAEDIPGELGAATGTGYFPEGIADRLRETLGRTGLVDGVAPAIIEQVALQAPSTRQNEPGVNLFATDPAHFGGFGSIATVQGKKVSFADLGPGEVFLNRKASEELGVGATAAVRLFTGPQPTDVTVREVVDFKGAGTADAAVLMPLTRAQAIFGKPHEIRHVLISNRGAGTSGVGLSDRVMDELAPQESTLGIEASAMKQDALETADETGNAFMSFFTTFGSFSIAAGILLIFLIFVMLAAERRGELGIARAIGTRRGHLTQMFVFEGLAYDVAAAAVGALLGAGVAYGMVLVMADAFGAADEDAGLQIEYAVTARSLLIAFALGVLITLAVVAFSAWRVSRMTISSAIRNLPETHAPKARRRWLAGGIGVVLGLLMAVGGASSDSATPLMLGVSIVLLSLVPILRALQVPDRVAYTSVGLVIVTILMLPWTWWEAVFGEMSMDFSTWIATGLIVVVGAVWLIIYNADVLLGLMMRSLGRIRALAPMLKMAMAYPLAGRFRTGTTLAMFTLVVFTLVTGTTSSGSFQAAIDDPERFGGGFDIRAGTGAALPITDMRAAIDRAPGLRPSDFTAVGSQSILAVDAKQEGTGRPYETYVARGLDRSFLEHTTFDLGAVARGYGSDREVWNAMASREGLAILDPFVVPRRDQFGFGAPESDFRATGFFFEDGVFDPFPVTVSDPQTGATRRVTVIGVLSDTAPLEMVGLSTSQATLDAAFPGRFLPTIHYFDLAPGVDADATVTKLEAAFLANGMEAESIEKVTADIVAANLLINRLIQGFMGLGLIVGVAALGVISARAVVERRQQIGVLRAIGFRRGMVQATFLLESSFVALTSILVGSVLGLILAYEIVRDSRRQPSWAGLELVVPWGTLAVIFGAVFVVALGATLVPALRASRIRPAEALRYE